MHTWREIYNQQDEIYETQYDAKEIKFDYDEKSRINHDTVFFLYVFNQIFTLYEYENDRHLRDQLVEYIIKYTDMKRDDDYGRPDPLLLSDTWRCIALERFEAASPFNIAIIERPKFFIYCFDLLTEVAFKVESKRMMQNARSLNRAIDIPISYDYFTKIICSSDVGGWKYLNEYGEVKKILSPISVDEITELEKIYNDDRQYVRRPQAEIDEQIKKYGVEVNGFYYSGISKEQHKISLAKKLDQIKGQKSNLKEMILLFEEKGYPYENTYDEYIRFLKTNLKYMKFGDFKIMMHLILDMFIPSSLF
jgi:hypothetical protein